MFIVIPEFLESPCKICDGDVTMTNWKPFVSVITPSYNASEYIEDTIQSVLHQSHPHWEMIIADDCSTDGTRDILRQYEQKDERIRVVYLDKNGSRGRQKYSP